MTRFHAHRGESADFEHFLEFAPDAIVGIGSSGTIEIVNGQTQRLFGYAHDELIGQHVEMLVPGRFRGAHVRHRDNYFSDPRTRPMGGRLELYGLCKDGTEFPAEISLSSIATADGVIATAAIRDVTDRVAAERKFEQFLEFAPDAIIGVAKGGRIAIVNAQTERLFGYTRAELIGQSVETLIPERFHPRHEGHRDGYMDDPRTRPMGAGLELHGRRKDGTEFPCEISLSSIDTEEGVMATAAIRDISDRVADEQRRKELEERLAEQIRLETERERAALRQQLNQMRRLETVGQLAGGIAHDFNNLLGVILNSAAFVAEDLPPESPSLEDVEAIHRAAERGAALTRQLLIFSRRDTAHKESLDLNNAIAELEGLLARAIGELVHLDLRREKDLWPIEGDLAQLEQVILNLAVNAGDAMPRGGTLTVETKNVFVDEDYVTQHPDAQIGQHVRLTVSDTGVGMRPEIVQRAFEPFFTTKPTGAGTGLGLATVYGIVSDAGGNVQIFSEAGVGTAVKILLPVTERPVAPAEPAPRPADRATGEKILVVEDEESVRRVARRILARSGYEVVEAADGAQALELLADTNDFDLMLTDVVMPEMLGNELVVRVRRVLPKLPVLFMSGYNDEILARDDAGEEAPAFVEKPFNAETLLASVRGVLGQAGS